MCQLSRPRPRRDAPHRVAGGARAAQDGLREALSVGQGDWLGRPKGSRRRPDRTLDSVCGRGLSVSLPAPASLTAHGLPCVIP
nr:MAG TPA: hypothetical protein [Caudoviricetes sp.]